MGDGTTPPKPQKKKDDVVLVHGKSERGDAYRVLRKRDDALEIGELRAAKEGQPIVGELVKLTPREEHDLLFDVEVLASAPAPERTTTSGPPQVATEAYRANWDTIFGGRRRPGLPN